MGAFLLWSLLLLELALRPLSEGAAYGRTEKYHIPHSASEDGIQSADKTVIANSSCRWDTNRHRCYREGMNSKVVLAKPRVRGWHLKNWAKLSAWPFALTWGK